MPWTYYDWGILHSYDATWCYAARSEPSWNTHISHQHHVLTHKQLLPHPLYYFPRRTWTLKASSHLVQWQIHILHWNTMSDVASFLVNKPVYFMKGSDASMWRSEANIEEAQMTCVKKLCGNPDILLRHMLQLLTASNNTKLGQGGLERITCPHLRSKSTCIIISGWQLVLIGGDWESGMPKFVINANVEVFLWSCISYLWARMWLRVRSQGVCGWRCALNAQWVIAIKCNFGCIVLLACSRIFRPIADPGLLPSTRCCPCLTPLCWSIHCLCDCFCHCSWLHGDKSTLYCVFFCRRHGTRYYNDVEWNSEW